MGTPAVMGVVDLPYHQLEARGLIVDGYKGEVITNPSEHLLEQFRATIREQEELSRDLGRA